MAFWRPYLRQRRTPEEYKAELEEDNSCLREALQSEVDINRQNVKWINQLEQDYTRCEQEIQDLNKEIERLENASEEEKIELKSEISSLKKQLYHAKKDVWDKEKHISSLEKQLVESEEQVEKLRCRIKVISSQKNSPVRGNSPDLYNSDIPMEITADLIGNINRGLDRIENHIRGVSTSLQNSINILDGIRGSLNTIQTTSQTSQQNLINITAERNHY